MHQEPTDVLLGLRSLKAATCCLLVARVLSFLTQEESW